MVCIREVCMLILLDSCYITVGMFARRGLGSLSKYTEWSVLGPVSEY